MAKPETLNQLLSENRDSPVLHIIALLLVANNLTKDQLDKSWAEIFAHARASLTRKILGHTIDIPRSHLH